jgi:RNA polymerase sigma factor (sigma-70 family)
VVVLTPAARGTARAKRDALIAAHLDLVPSIARQIARQLPTAFELDDLIQTGNLALCTAAARYRPSEHAGAPFSAFARQRIRGAILDSVRRRHYANSTMGALEDAAEPAAPNVIETEIDRGRLRKKVEKALAQLPAREREILEAYYSPAEPDLRAVGAVHRIGAERARQLKNGALERLRAGLR